MAGINLLRATLAAPRTPQRIIVELLRAEQLLVLAPLVLISPDHQREQHQTWQAKYGSLKRTTVAKYSSARKHVNRASEVSTAGTASGCQVIRNAGTLGEGVECSCCGYSTPLPVLQTSVPYALNLILTIIVFTFNCIPQPARYMFLMPKKCYRMLLFPKIRKVCVRNRSKFSTSLDYSRTPVSGSSAHRACNSLALGHHFCGHYPASGAIGKHS